MSAKVRISYNLELVVRSPFLFRGLVGARFGVDAAVLRDETGTPIIPSDQIRGVLREALEDIADNGGFISQAQIETIFGAPSVKTAERESNEPLRGVVIFSDLAAQDMILDPSEQKAKPVKLTPGGQITRIEIDDATGAVARGAVLVTELAAPLGADVRFKGEIVIFAAKEQARKFEKLFTDALRLPASIGAFKTIGFGEIIAQSSKVSLPTNGIREIAPPATARIVEERRRYRVVFDRPVLVDSERIAKNAFLGSPIIPGAVFKGALATRLDLAGDDAAFGPFATALSTLSFSHAFPESKTLGEPGLAPLPLSLAAAKVDDKVHYADALGLPEGVGGLIEKAPALFQPDWKEGWDSDAGVLIGAPATVIPEKLARTHTTIENGVAADEQLFSTVAFAARKASGEPYSWILDIDLGRVAEHDSDAAARLVATFEQGLDLIGKTQASAQFEYIGRPPVSSPASFNGAADDYAIVLQTPALLLDPGAGGWPESPRAAYATYFQSVFPGVELVDFFAQQRLAGGYLSRRRQAHKAYYPFLLTTAGSVFLLRGLSAEALAPLLRFGLPTPARSENPFTWRNCPFVPENGFGRISANYRAKGSQIPVVEHA